MSSATIIDVARHAGVSIKTVSRVLNFEPNVREQTRAKVLAAAEALKYRPNVSARSLAGARSYLIGLLFDNPSPAYVADVQMGAVARCRQAGYHLIVEPIDSEAADLDAVIEPMLDTLKVDGLILTPPVCDNAVILDALDRAGASYVRIAPENEPDRSAYVHMDDRRAAYDMTAYLLGLGHAGVGFVIGHPDHGASHLRYEGYRQALADHGRPFREDHVRQGQFSFRSGFEAGESLLTGAERPTAVFASNDDMALGVMAAAHRLGLSIPEQLSVAGFDDTPGAKVVWPQLTTIRQPIMEMASAAAELLISGEAAKRTEGGGPVSRLLDFDLVVRESTAPPSA